MALSDADRCFSHMLVRKANAVEEEGTWAIWYHHQNTYRCLVALQ